MNHLLREDIFVLSMMSYLIFRFSRWWYCWWWYVLYKSMMSYLMLRLSRWWYCWWRSAVYKSSYYQWCSILYLGLVDGDIADDGMSYTSQWCRILWLRFSRWWYCWWRSAVYKSSYYQWCSILYLGLVDGDIVDDGLTYKPLYDQWFSVLYLGLVDGDIADDDLPYTSLRINNDFVSYI